MRLFLALFLPLASFALDNAIRVYPSATQTNRPFLLVRNFMPDDICAFPRPKVNGTAATSWQSNVLNRWPASTVCPSGSVRRAYVAFRATTTNAVEMVVEFVESADACHLGNAATCEAAAMDEATMLAHNGGTWDASITAEPNATIASIPVTKSARTMLDAAYFTYRVRGPIVTQVVVEDRTTARSQDFGFRIYQFAKLLGDISSGVTTIPADAMHWSGITRPFKIVMNSEVISICYVNPSTGYLYVGTTNGSDSSCASNAGRAQDGSSQPYAHYQRPNGTIQLDTGVRIASGVYGYATSIPVNDASSFTDVTTVRTRNNVWRICNKSGNTLIAGVGAWGCAADSLGTQRGGWNGSDQSAYAPLLNEADLYWIASNNDATKGLHPMFVLTFFTGHAGVGVEYLLENTWYDRSQDHVLDLTFTTNAGTIGTMTDRHILARSRLKYPDGPTVGMFTNVGSGAVADRKIWTGTAPAAVRMDYNFAYLRASSAIPYDAKATITQGFLDQITTDGGYTQVGNVRGWDDVAGGQNKCAVEALSDFDTSVGRAVMGPHVRTWSVQGGRPDIGLNHGWLVGLLYAMKQQGLTKASRWEEMFFGFAACSSYFPMHLTESSTTNDFCNPVEANAVTSCTGGNLTAKAFGREMSIDARPGLTNIDPTDTTNEYRGPASTGYWNVGDGTAHFAETQLLPWLLTNDLIYEQNLRGSAFWALYTSVSAPLIGGAEENQPYYWARVRQSSWGFATCLNGCRTAGWHQRALIHAWLTGSDGDATQQYYGAKLANYAGRLEGKWGITDGPNYVPCSGGNWRTSPWCYGNKLYSANAAQWASPDTMALFDGGEGNTVASYVYGVQSFWMDNYMRISHGYGLENGISSLSRVVKQYLHLFSIRTFILPNPFNVGEYRDPNIPCVPEVNAPFVPNCPKTWYITDFATTDPQFSTPAQWWNGFNSTVQTRTAYPNDNDQEHGYSVIYTGTAALLGDQEVVVGGQRYTGRRLVEATRRLRRYHEQVPRSGVSFAFGPLFEYRIPIRTSVSGTSASIYAQVPDGGACTYYEGTTRPTSSVTTGETAILAGIRERKLVLTGLAAGTHYIRITCGDARGFDRFTIE